MKKLLILIIYTLVIFSFVYAVEFTPQGNINLRNIYNITNVPEYNGTNINITGLYFGNGSQLTGVLTGVEADLNVNRSDWWDNLNTPNDINSLTGLTAINSTLWTNVTITESQISDLTHTTLTNIFDQVLNTTSNVTFDQLNLTNFGNDLIPFADSRFDFGSTLLRWLTGWFDNVVVGVGNFTSIFSNDWTNVTITESQISDLVHTGKATDGIYLYNDSLTIFFNDTLAGTNLSVNSSDFWDGLNTPADILGSLINNDLNWINQTTGNATYILQVNEGNLNVNRSDFWDNLNVPTDLNNKLTLLEANITDLQSYILTANEGNLNVNSSNFWDNLNTFNTTHFVETSGVLTLVESFFTNLFILISDESTLNVNSSDFWDGLDTPLDFSAITASGLITAGEFSGPNNWTFLQNFPSACPAGTFLTQLDDSVTCTAPVADDVDPGDFPSGNYSFDTNVLFIDSSSNRIGIGTATPQNTLNVIGTANITQNANFGQNITLDGTTDSVIYNNGTHIIWD